MTGRFSVIASLVVLAAALAACSERSQVLDTSARVPDAQAWAVSDAAKPEFTASGWKAGDRASWEEQIRKRNQAQNEYVR